MSSGLLPIDAVRGLAASEGYEEIQHNQRSRVVAFRKRSAAGHHDVRVNVYYTTGTIATCLDHPRSGKTQLFRRGQTLADLATIFRDPRTHTGAGYYYCHRVGRDPWVVASATTTGSASASAGANHRGSAADEECDDVRRWKYVCAATGNLLANHPSQVAQIAAFCKLYDRLRFIQDGGLTSREQYEAYSEETKQGIAAINPGLEFCNDDSSSPPHDRSKCHCCERAGAWCSLMGVLARVARRTERVLGFVNLGDTDGRGGEDQEEDQQDDGMKVLGVDTICDCACQEGGDFQLRHGGLLTRLERQLLSMPRNTRRELLVWYVSKQTRGFVPFSVTRNDRDETEPVLLGAAHCSDVVLGCHHDYGELMYDDTRTKGCPCHGL